MVLRRPVCLLFFLFYHLPPLLDQFMSGKNVLLLVLPLCLLMTGCEDLPKTTQSGLRYVMHHHKAGARKAKPDEFLMLHVVIKANGDSILRSTYTQEKHPLPQIAPPDTLKNGELGEALAMLSEGDSATFLFNADQMFAKAGQPIPNGIKKGSDISYTFKVTEILDKSKAEQVMNKFQQEAQAAAEKNAIAQKETDTKLIEEYLSKNKMTTAVKTASGLAYLVTKEGVGETPVKGKTVVVNYTGKLLDGTVFDTNLKDKDSKPAEFPIGVGAVIPGWDEGLLLVKKGSKVTFVIPSELAYGPNGSGPIPPNSVLVFDVDLLDIKK
jgi:FKBP-type peptidyl-prolyl cis-trans isomerase FkpA